MFFFLVHILPLRSYNTLTILAESFFKLEKLFRLFHLSNNLTNSFNIYVDRLSDEHILNILPRQGNFKNTNICGYST